MKPKNIVNNDHYRPLFIEHSAVSIINKPTIEDRNYLADKNENQQRQNKAYIEIKRDSKTGEEKAIVQLPKGKRLFDEESLKEISRDATI